MPKVVVVTDSTSALPKDMAESLGIRVLPLYIAFGQESFRDGVDLTPAQFYARLRSSSTLPTTSQPAVGDFLALYRSLSAEAEAIVSVHISRELSGTISSAYGAREALQAEAQKTGVPAVPIHIVDTRSVSMGAGFMALAAARAARDGKSAAEVAAAAEALVPRMNVIFTAETLEYLHKGGRIGGAATLLGTILSIKPILQLRDGRVDAYEKPRTRKQALARLPQIMAERVGQDERVHVAILHADAPAEAEQLQAVIRERFRNADIAVVGDVGATIGAHAGPGTIGIGFYTDP